MPDEPHEPSGRRGRRAAWLAGGALALVAVLVLAIVVWARQGEGASGADVPHFVNDTQTAGVDHAYTGEFEYFVGGGVAALDCDGNGLDDLYLAGGSAPAALFRNRSELRGALRFERLTSAVTDLTAVTGAYPIDVDSDGQIDLVVLRREGDVVLRGLGDCRFEPMNDRLGLQLPTGWSTAFSATWERDSALPTLAIGRYLTLDRDHCDDSLLLRPSSTSRYAAPVALRPAYCTLSVLFSDWDRSGRRDLRLTNDRHYYVDGSEQLWRVAPGEAPHLYTEADGWRPLQIWGMGIASQDLDGDGYPEVFLTSQADNKLQTLANGPTQPTYRDIALRSGVTAQRPFIGGDVLPSTAWHPEFADVNNDGFVDLLVTKGNVEAQPDYASKDPSNLFMGAAGGTFTEGAPAAGMVDYTPSRGAAVVDLNLDGLLDVVMVHRRTNVTLWRNVGHGTARKPAGMGGWTALRLQQPAPNVDAIGALVEVQAGGRSQTREVTIGGGHAGGQLGWIHFGLGHAGTAQVRVTWPDGERGPWLTVRVGELATVERGATEASPWTPGG